MAPSVEEAERKLDRLLQRAVKAGLSRPVCSKLLEYKASKSSESTSSTKCFIWGALVAGVVLAYAADLLSYQGLLRAYLVHSGSDIYSEMCTVYMPDWVSRAVRPAEDCSICINLTSVDRVSQITPQEFELKYAYSGIPVVITDATTEWSAPEVFGLEFFKELYDDVPDQRGCQFFPYQTEFTSLHDVLHMSPARAEKPWYVGWSNCDDRAAQVLREHYSRPYFLPELSENKNTDWIFMGSPGYGAKMHVDNVKNPSWQAQLVGSKQWTLEPPPECYFKCSTLQLTVNPGEIIVLDTNRWYHKTEIVSDSISITIGAEYD